MMFLLALFGIDVAAAFFRMALDTTHLWSYGE